MGKLIVLGSSFVIPDETHENTHFVLLGSTGLVLVDCPGRAMIRLRRAGLDPFQIQDILLTHFHPDHVDGVPMLIMEMWLKGRKTPLHFYGWRHCLSRIENLMQAYDLASWPNMFAIHYHMFDEVGGEVVFENADWRIQGWPVQHFIPTMGLRVTDKATGRVLAYSCDTQPCPNDLELATQADVFMHEAAGAGFGHSSAAQAGEMAAQAGARQLVLIHYRTGGVDPQLMVPEAQQAFAGPVRVAEDLMPVEW